MKNKCVFFIGALREGGAERVVSLLTDKLVETNKNIEIICYYDYEVFYKINPKVRITFIQRETGTKNILTNVLWLRKYVKKNVSTIVSFLAPFNMVALVATIGIKKKIIVADRNDPRYIPSNLIIRKLRDFLYNFADAVVVQTTNNKEYFSRRIQEKIAVIHNPVDMGEKRGMALQTPKKKRIVSVGRLMPQKNQKMLLQAFAIVSQDFPEYELTIYGEGDYRTELEKEIKTLGLETKVMLPGKEKNVFDKIANAELFVLSSDYEGMPNALIEAMCLGLPVVSTAVSGTSDLIEGDVNGIIVEIGNKEQLIYAMKELIADEEKRAIFAKNAIAINDKLQSEFVSRQWEVLIREVEYGVR